MSPRRTRRLVPLAAAAALACPSAAFAHATLVRSVPADGAVLASAPREVRLDFDDTVQPAGGNEVVRNRGGAVLRGSARVEGGGRVLVLPLRARLQDGDYSVRWRVLSDDGHFVTGVLAFGVGAGRPPPQSVLRAASGNPAARDVLSRWLMFAGLLAAAGIAAFSRFALRRPTAAEQRRIAAVLAAGFVLFAVGAGTLAQRAGWGTRFGSCLHVGVALALVGAVLALLAAGRPRFRPVASLCAVAIAAVPTFAGHALDAGVPWPNVPVDLLHVAAAGVWVGGLLGLVVVRPAAPVVRRVSALALGSVAVLAATGIVRAVFELRALHQLWTTGYGVAILVKSGLLLVLVALGWLNRSRLLRSPRLRRSVLVELAVLAGVVVAVAFLTQVRPGRDAPRAAATPTVSAPLQAPPPPPAGALVLARESGTLGVAVAVLPQSVTVTVIAPSGGGADGLNVAIAGRHAQACGHGCYRSHARAGRRLRVTVEGRAVDFFLPSRTPPASAFMRRASRAFTRLRSVEYDERLASSPTRVIVTRWRLEAPNRLAYAIRGDGQAIVIGARRWDRSSAAKPWLRSESSPLRVPQPVWGTTVVDARVLAQSGRYAVVAWANPTVPAWFTARFDRRTLLPVEVHMTAAAHFMRHRYLSFNRPLGIRPP